MISYCNLIGNPKYSLNMDETAVYLNCSPNRTVYPKGEKTVSIMFGRSSSTRFTLAVTIVMDGSKLPLFVIFKGTPGGNIERSLNSTLPDGIFGCVQPKAWMDNRTMTIWYNSVVKPYISGYNGTTGLLLVILSVITVRALFHCWEKAISEITRFRRTTLHCCNPVMSALTNHSRID